MLIVGVSTKLVRRRHKGRQADTWCLNLSPVISQLFLAGGHDFVYIASTTGRKIHITCRPGKPRVWEVTARLWLAEDLLRGTLRLPHNPQFWDLPDVVEGLLSAHDSSTGNPDESSLPPYLTWEGAVE